MINTWGHFLRLTAFGESHGVAIGGVIDGFPAGISIDEDEIVKQLLRRSPANQKFASGRKEKDKVEFLSGLNNGTSIGTPIAFMVRNTDARPEDYQLLSEVYRPSHADYSWAKKFGTPSGTGGGRTSARVMLPMVVAGTLAGSVLRNTAIEVMAWVDAIGPINASVDTAALTLAQIEKSMLRCPDKKAKRQMEQHLDILKKDGDTAGGVIKCLIRACPAGLGEPIFGKISADLAHAMMTINSVRGIELGAGFEGCRMPGSQYNDAFSVKNKKIFTLTNHDGGVNGGITNGSDILMKIAFKPVPSISQEQHTVNHDGKVVKLKIKGRHDTCVLPRAVPIVEAMARFVLADYYLMQKARS